MNKMNYQKPQTKIHSINYSNVMASSPMVNTTETEVTSSTPGFTLGAKIWKNFDEE